MIEIKFTGESLTDLRKYMSDFLVVTEISVPPINTVDDSKLKEAKTKPGVLHFEPAEEGKDKAVIMEKKKKAKTATFEQLEAPTIPAITVVDVKTPKEPTPGLEWETVRNKLTDYYKKINQDKGAMLSFLEQFDVKFVGQLRDKPEYWPVVLSELKFREQGI